MAVRKTLLDPNGTPSRGDLGGFTFQIKTLAGATVGRPFTTNSHGHALSDEVEVGEYLLTEFPPVPPQPTMQPPAPQPFTLNSAHAVLRIENRLPVGTNPYGA